MTEHQASRAAHQPGGGMDAVERDVRGLSPAQVIKGLVEGILEQTHFVEGSAREDRVRLSMIQGHAERLAVLLDERDEEREAMKLMLAKTLGALQGVRDSYPEHHWPSVNAIIEEADKFIAALKGGS